MNKHPLLRSLLLIVAILIFFVVPCSCIPWNSSSPYPGYGRDTRLILGDGKFQILETADGYSLIISAPTTSSLEGSMDILLTNLNAKDYKKIGDILYVASLTDGYAVINGQTDECRMLRYADAIANQYYQWPDLINDPSIAHLSLFSDFTTVEQKILKKLN